MPFTQPGADVAMKRNPATGKLDFDIDGTGNPRYSDDNVHRVLSLLVEHRPFSGAPGSPVGPGWWADETGKRGSLLWTVKNVRRSTPSQLEAFALDALQKAVNEGWIASPTAKAFLAPPARLEIAWMNPGGRPASVRVALST